MKRIIIHIILLITFQYVSSQITTPIKRANFGLDASMRANFFNGVPDTDDDWFRRSGDAGTGDYVIDTTGAAAIVAGYTSNPASRYYSFARGMRYPLLSTINNRIYYDASFIRDNHNQPDSTSFSGGSKNGMSPAVWSTTTSPVLGKNDIMDVLLHVRRDGVNAADTLWFFGAVGLLGTNGDRYFDFELYQTDITFNKTTGKFVNAGPDAGHTSWTFDASGNTTRLGDIIFTAEYSNAGLSFIEARIWVNKSYLTSTNPLAFDWTGTFDGDGSGATFGYAGIRPNDGGSFYQGMQNAAATWAGPFGAITSGGAVATDFNPIQMMEFSVNLTKLGLDPMNFSSGSMCNLAFGKVLVKTRTSSSFTASITDFVSPFKFSTQANVDAAANFPLLCPTQTVVDLNVINPLQTSNYYWTTTNGSFVSSSTGTAVQVNGPGTYVVHQEMLTGCGVSARDTITIVYNSKGCDILNASITQMEAAVAGQNVNLHWEINGHPSVKSMVLERSADGLTFTAVADIAPQQHQRENAAYRYTDQQAGAVKVVYYRLRVEEWTGTVRYSKVVILRRTDAVPFSFTVNPNPVKESPVRITIHADVEASMHLRVVHMNGQLLHQQQLQVKKGENQYWIRDVAAWPRGSVVVQLRKDQFIESRQVLVTR